MKLILLCCFINLIFICCLSRITVEEDIPKQDKNIDELVQKIERRLNDDNESTVVSEFAKFKPLERKLLDHRDIFRNSMRPRRDRSYASRNRMGGEQPEYRKMTRTVRHYDDNRYNNRRVQGFKRGFSPKNKFANDRRLQSNKSNSVCKNGGKWRMVGGSWKWVVVDCYSGAGGSGSPSFDSNGFENGIRMKNARYPNESPSIDVDVDYNRNGPFPGKPVKGQRVKHRSQSRPGVPLPEITQFKDGPDLQPLYVPKQLPPMYDPLNLKAGPIRINTDYKTLRHDMIRFRNQNRHIQLIHSDQRLVEELWKSLHVNFNRYRHQLQSANKYNGIVLRTNLRNNLRNIRNAIKNSALRTEDLIYRENAKIYREMNNKAKTFENQTLTNTTVFYDTTNERVTNFVNPDSNDYFY